MKGKISYYVRQKKVERDVNFIPVRYLFAIALTVLAVAAVMAIVLALCMYVPYFYLMMWATEISFVICIIASNENPDYKIPWLIVVLVIPIGGLMLYILFHSRKLKKKYVRRMEKLKSLSYSKEDSAEFARLKAESLTAHNQAKMLCSISEAHLFQNTRQEYFSLGETMLPRMLEDLRSAEQFIFLEYFIIEEGKFWDSILAILKEKAASGVEVKVVYDDCGCMMTLPGDYFRILKTYGIDAAPFSMLRGNADSEFNNRSHRKIMVIDGKIGYTGGVNIADEYINEVVKYGHWKDIGLRLEGNGVKELTKLFLLDYGLNVWKEPKVRPEYFPAVNTQCNGWVVPFGDGPYPIYQRRVGQTLIETMLNQAQRYLYMMTPYLIIDNELCQTIENAALRGVEVKIIVPHVPDKKLVFEMTQSHYARLMAAGVQIYEYEPGFIHAKCYLADDEYAMMGTINMDYRSLVHHFENGVWMYRCDAIRDIRKDFDDTLEKSIQVEDSMLKVKWYRRLLRALLKVFAPML